ncbi:MAG: HNH endonuclease [Pseudomonadota bacterium]
MLVYIWNLTHGGRATLPYEYRIQVTGLASQQFVQDPGRETIILGWYDELGIFAAFDIRRHTAPLGDSPSIQIHRDALEEAYKFGLGFHRKENGEMAVALQPPFMGFYLDNREALHDVGMHERDLNVLRHAAHEPSKVDEEQVYTATESRRQTIISVKKAVRDNSFKERVLTAYGRKCAVCGLQLELVEAAHIVPVSYPDSNDHTSNGLALCSLHHSAFDRHLIEISDDHRISVVEPSLARLRDLKLNEREKEFVQMLRPIIVLPPERAHRPRPEYLRLGRRLRAGI